ncbi:MAG: DUF350 domain-containing protein [bacterium]|nr:DUF350 domain-containing protein [bacterium]
MSSWKWIIVAILLSLAVLYIVKKWLDYRTPYDDDKCVIEDCNMAVSLRRIGWFIGIALALAGSLTSITKDVDGLLEFLMDFAIAFILLNIAGMLANKVILPRVNNSEEIGKGNVAVGLLEAGVYIGLGTLLFGAFTGSGGGTLSAAVFGSVGVLLFILLFKIIDWVTPIDLSTEISGGSLAAAMSTIGDLLSLGLILGVSIAGPFEGWAKDFQSFAVSAVLGVVALMVIQKLVDWFFLPKVTINDEIRSGNLASMVLVEGTTLAVVIVASVMLVTF